MFFSSLYSLCTLTHSDIITLVSAIITGGIAATGALLAVSLEYFKTRRERINKIQDERNNFRVEVLQYLENRLNKITPLLNNQNINDEFINEILETFNEQFFSGVLLENKNIYSRMQGFINGIRSLLEPSANNTTQQCYDYIATLIIYLQNELKKARRK